jgi:hypothetical protein
MRCSAKSSKRSGHPAPPHAGEVVGLSRRFGFADRSDSPRAVAGGGEALGRDAHRLAVDTELAVERSDSGKPGRVEQNAIALPANVCGSAIGP